MFAHEWWCDKWVACVGHGLNHPYSGAHGQSLMLGRCVWAARQRLKLNLSKNQKKKKKKVQDFWAQTEIWLDIETRWCHN